MVLDIGLIMAGLLVGFCVGVTGVGGGSLMTPMLIGLFHVPANIAIGTDLLFAAISKFCGSAVHARKLNIVWPIVFWLGLGSIPASLATTFVLEHVAGGAGQYKALLTMTLGFMLMLTGISIVFRTQIENWFARRRPPVVDAQATQAPLITGRNRGWVLLMGVVLGIFVTLSSVGAGAFGIMALVLLFPHLAMIRIIGSDVAHAVLLTLVAGMSHFYGNNVDLNLLGNLLIGSIPAIIIGTLVAHRMPERLIRRVLGLTLLLLGINFMINPSKTKAAPVQPAAVTSTAAGSAATPVPVAAAR